MDSSLLHTTWTLLVEELKHILEAQAPEAPEVQEDSLMMDWDWAAARMLEIKNEKRTLSEAKEDLDGRETRVLEPENRYRDVLAMAKQLQDIGIDFDLFLPWKEAYGPSGLFMRHRGVGHRKFRAGCRLASLPKCFLSIPAYEECY